MLYEDNYHLRTETIEVPFELAVVISYSIFRVANRPRADAPQGVIHAANKCFFLRVSRLVPFARRV